MKKIHDSLDISFVRDLKFEEIIPNVIDGIAVYIDKEGNHSFYLQSKITGEKLKYWMKGRGGIYSIDVRNFSKGNKVGKYILLKTDKDQKIARVINDDELEVFTHLNLIDGQIGQINFMILRTIENGHKLISSDIYKIEEHEEDSEFKININPHIPSEEDSDDHEKNVALFN